MVNITKKHDVGNTLLALGGIYISGVILQAVISDNFTNNIADYLSNKREAIVRNIGRYTTNIEIAKEPYLSQYKDSLEHSIINAN